MRNMITPVRVWPPWPPGSIIIIGTVLTTLYALNHQPRVSHYHRATS